VWPADAPAERVHQQIDDQECQAPGQSCPHREAGAEPDVPRAGAESETTDRRDQQGGGHKEEGKDHVNRQTGVGILRNQRRLGRGQEDSDEYHARADGETGGPRDTPFMAEAGQASHVPTPPARCDRDDAHRQKT
jgi:hypothetical protein